MDVPQRRLGEARVFGLALIGLVVLGLLLRLKGIGNPILDHPGWRQGDTSAIARNFALLQFNPLFPQTDYNGPPPNYVELELQIVPFLAAIVYKIVGVHVIVARLIGIAFGLGTIAVSGLFARWLFRSSVAGIAAAAFITIAPGAWYYSRTVQPDTAMAFFATWALYASARWIVERRADARGLWPPVLLLCLAFLAKPVAVIAIVPIAACAVATLGWRDAARRWTLWALAVCAFVPLWAYDHIVSSHAEWHWTSGITRLHVIPGLIGAFTSAQGFGAKAVAFGHAFRMLGTTILGPLGALLALAGIVRHTRSRSETLLWGWLAADLVYAYVVVTVERVDYYLYLFVPLAALFIGGLTSRLVVRSAHHVDEQTVTMVRPAPNTASATPDTASAAPDMASATPNTASATPDMASAAPDMVSGANHEPRWWPAAIAAGVFVITAYTGYQQVKPYWAYSKNNHYRALTLDRQLAPGALIVMAHYDPSILYYINRKGWEEDPKLWTPFDEQSAIRKGARYFVSVEHARLKQTNLELYCWLDRFPRLDLGPDWKWPVYRTDPANVKPGAESRWRAFRTREMRGDFRDWRRTWATQPDPCGGAAG